MDYSSLHKIGDLLAAGRFILRTDSRLVQPGDLFVALPPADPRKQDLSPTYIRSALDHGAAIIVSSSPAPEADGQSTTGWIQVDDGRDALGYLASCLYHTNRLPFPLIGLTGTNGKTTSAYLLEHLYKSAGRQTGVLGTVSYRWPGHEEAAPLTTPDCLTLHENMAAMAAAGQVQAAIMEVSSHALDQKRIAGLEFSAALFTNLTQDHLDYHAGFEEYFQAKRRLFLSVPKPDKITAINADDAYGRRLLSELPNGSGFSLHKPVGEKIFLNCRVIADSTSGLRMELTAGDETWELSTPLVGRHNAYNLAGVVALGLQLGFRRDDFKCFEYFQGVSGRLERILPAGPCDPKFKEVGIFVDYAHTPDALERAQEALRDAGFTRLITVFGCGGDRDRSKRPRMGEAVARLSDVAVVTSDNPRTENPEAVIDDIMPGLAKAAEIYRESDRRRALSLSLDLLRPGDALLVAGKGHESYQIIGTTKYPFSDQQTLLELMACE